MGRNDSWDKGQGRDRTGGERTGGENSEERTWEQDMEGRGHGGRKVMIENRGREQGEVKTGGERTVWREDMGSENRGTGRRKDI